MDIPLIVVLWEHANYGGTKRTLVQQDDDALLLDLAGWDFDRKASAYTRAPVGTIGSASSQR
jgi:hypothetical protein